MFLKYQQYFSFYYISRNIVLINIQFINNVQTLTSLGLNFLNKLSDKHPWFNDFNDEDLKYDRIFGKWLTPMTKKRIEMDSLFLVNGWLAHHYDNNPLTEKISDLFNVLAYDGRGIGKSIRSGSMTVKQAALDMNHFFMKSLHIQKKFVHSHGIDPSRVGKVFLLGSCIGGLPIAAAYAAKLPITQYVSGIIIISPISKFIPHIIARALYFLPPPIIYIIKKWLAKPIIDIILPSKNATDTRELAIKRAKRIDPWATNRHAREFLWRGDVKDAWKYITVPTILIVGDKDPVAPIENSLEVYHQLKYPIWLKLNAPSHLILEYNLEYIRKNFLSFTKDPFLFYQENLHLIPEESSNSE